MNNKQTLSEYLMVLKNLERRLKTVERRQKEMDEKLDHIIFRLVMEGTKNSEIDKTYDGDICRNGYDHFKGI